MTTETTRPRSRSATETIVFSARVRPETAEGLRHLAKESGLAFDALLHRALSLLRADPAISRLTERVKEVDAILEEIRAPSK